MIAVVGSGSTAALLALLVALAGAAAVCEAFVPQAQPLQMMATGVKRNPNFGKLVGGLVPLFVICLMLDSVARQFLISPP